MFWPKKKWQQLPAAAGKDTTPRSLRANYMLFHVFHAFVIAVPSAQNTPSFLPFSLPPFPTLPSFLNNICTSVICLYVCHFQKFHEDPSGVLFMAITSASYMSRHGGNVHWMNKCTYKRANEERNGSWEFPAGFRERFARFQVRLDSTKEFVSRSSEWHYLILK